jgi:hypothetical protein
MCIIDTPLLRHYWRWASHYAISWSRQLIQLTAGIELMEYCQVSCTGQQDSWLPAGQPAASRHYARLMPARPAD